MGDTVVTLDNAWVVFRKLPERHQAYTVCLLYQPADTGASVTMWVGLHTIGQVRRNRDKWDLTMWGNNGQKATKTEGLDTLKSVASTVVRHMGVQHAA